MGRKTIRDQIRQKEAVLKHAEARIKELKTAVNDRNHEINILQQQLASDGPSTNGQKESLGNNRKELEQGVREIERIKEDLARKDEALSTMSLALSQKEREIERLEQALHISEQAFQAQLEEKGNEGRELLVGKDAEIMALKEALGTPERDLRQKREENEKIKKQLGGKEEELKTMSSLVREKEQELEESSHILKKKELEFKHMLSEKDSEIDNIKNCLMVTKKEIQRIKARTFWQKLKVCFQHQ
jgi:chromosome segregation ATPase